MHDKAHARLRDAWRNDGDLPDSSTEAPKGDRADATKPTEIYEMQKRAAEALRNRWLESCK